MLKFPSDSNYISDPKTIGIQILQMSTYKTTGKPTKFQEIVN